MKREFTIKVTIEIQEEKQDESSKNPSILFKILEFKNYYPKHTISQVREWLRDMHVSLHDMVFVDDKPINFDMYALNSFGIKCKDGVLWTE